MFFNISNHRTETWSNDQYYAAEALTTEKGGCDIAFPQVDPAATIDDIREIANRLICEVKYLATSFGTNDYCVIIQGEMTLVHQFLLMAEKAGIRCYSACTKREVIEESKEDGSTVKTSIFKFCGFRPYF